MTVLVTGATGFVGGHVARLLVARGEGVRCLVRSSSRREGIAGLGVEVVEGDLREPESLRRAVAGCRVVYHCAADYRFSVRDPREIYASNVDGTRNLLAAARAAGVERVVHTSSVGALGRRHDGAPADEETPVSLGELIGPYKRSKFLAERAADEAAAAGLPVVIVNPSTPVGEGDAKPTPTGQMIVDFMNRRMPAYVDTGLNLIDVRDVAAGHLLAAERGVPGRRYILGCRNLSLLEILGLLAGLTGIPAPRFRLPHLVPLAAAAVDAGVARLLGRRPRLSLEAVRLARHTMTFDASRAVAELGLPQSPVEDALARAVAWYGEHGYAPAAAAAVPAPAAGGAR
jgi:dihydroflavonol-4-reductase